VWVPHGVTSPASILLQRGLLSPRGHRSCQGRAPHGVTASLGHPPAPAWGPFHRLQVEICSTMDLHGLQGHSLPDNALLHGLQGNLCSSTWSTSSPPSELALVSAELFLSHILTLVICCSCYCANFAEFFCSLHNYVIPEVLPPLLMGSAVASRRSVLELAGTGSVRHRGSFWHLLT